LFFPQKSYRHPALREQTVVCVVYDDGQILGAKIQKTLERKTLWDKKTNYYGPKIW
jgi:hypothetical protein